MKIAAIICLIILAVMQLFSFVSNKDPEISPLAMFIIAIIGFTLSGIPLVFLLMM